MKKVSEMKSSELFSEMTETQKDAIYRMVWSEHVRNDVLSVMDEYEGKIPEDEKQRDELVDYVVNAYVYNGKYDCNLSYWDNLKNLLDCSLPIKGLSKVDTIELKKIFRTNAVCPKCGNHLHTTDVYGYGFTCKECDENFVSFEVKKVDSEMLEISVPMSLDYYVKNEETFKSIADIYKCDFLGFDDTCNIMDIGWNALSIPDSDTLYQLCRFLNQIEID